MNIQGQFKCQRCSDMFSVEPEDDNPQTKLCYYCFEDALEEYEERRRERIARKNEY